MRTRKQLLHFLLGIVLAAICATPVQAFHFPWDQGHDIFTPNPPDDSQEPECPDEDNRCETSNPVDIGAGDKIQTYVDFNLPGFGPQLALVRAYHSQDLSDGPFGFGWHTNLTTRLILVTDGETNTAIVVQGNGKRKRFTQLGDGTWNAAPGTYQTLTVETDGSASLRDKHGTTHYFNRVGRLTQIADRNNNTFTIGYDAAGFITTATAASGRALIFTKGADGRVASVSDPLGRVFQYFYDANGYMVRAVDPMGGETLYSYYADGNLHTVTDARGNTAITLTYDDQDRVTQEVLADGATYRFEYLSDTQTRVTNPRSYQTLYTFNATGQPLEVRDPLGRTTRSTWDDNYNRLSYTDGNGHTTTYSYDGNGNLLTETNSLNQITSNSYEPNFSLVTSETDTEGNATQFEYDARGNLIQITDALGNQATLTYDTRGLLTSVNDFRGNITGFGYDAAGNLTNTTDAHGNTITITYDVLGNRVSKTDTEGRTTTYEYDALNRRSRMVDAVGGITTFTYDANNNLVSATDPRGNTTLYSYDSRNRHTGITNALAQTETRGYDANGNLLSVTDITGNTTAYAYDAADQLTTQTLAGGAVYSYAYDNAGNWITVTDPTGVRTDQAYDPADRPTQLLLSNGDKETYSYNSLGKRSSTERRNGADQLLFKESIAYDALSQVVQVIGGMGQTTDLAYDANGNLISITDPLGRVTTRAFDVLNHVVQLTDAAGGITQHTYDRVGNLTSLTDPKGLATAYGYDALNRQTQLDSPDTGTSASVYDANGNLTQQTDSRGIVMSHAYDALDRRTSTSFPLPGEDRAYLYDQGLNGNGRLAGYDDDSGQTRFTYDVRGNVLTESRTVQGSTYDLNYGYDNADRLNSLTYPSGLVVVYGHNGQGRVQSITADGQPVLSNISYLPFGPANGWTDGSGLDHIEVYDNSYRSTNITVGVLQDFGYLYDSADNITEWNDTLDVANNQSFGYDAIDRVVNADGPYGIVDFTYDDVGNRLSKTIGPDQTVYNYAADSHRLQETTGADPAAYSYDAAGNLIQDDRFEYVYNQANRLVEVKQGGITVATYTYNAEGQRVSKTVGGNSYHFVYGPRGQLLGRYDAATGDAIEELVYLGTRPIASIRPDGVHFVHTDHLGTPRAVSNSSQQIVWRWVSKPFGDGVANEDPDGDGISFSLHLRLPGQFYDTETETAYNYSRYYDPAVGRYIESDPTGLGGGINTYAYVGNNPLKYVDPKGESAAAAVGSWIGTDIAVPEPSDAAWPKWAGYAVAMAGALALDAIIDSMSNEDASSDQDSSDSTDDSEAEESDDTCEKPKPKRRFSEKDRDDAFEESKDEDGVPRCEYCDEEITKESGKPNSYEADHRNPYSKGGESTKDNLAPSCRTCNRSKGSKTPDEWGGRN